MTYLPYLSIHKLSGADAGSFLHAQLAADIAALGDGHSCFAAYCSPRGQVIALLLVCRLGSTWFIVAEASLASLVVKRLRMFVLRAKVVIEEQPGFHVVGLFAHGNNTSQSTVFAPPGMTLRYALSANAPADDAQMLRWRQEELRHGVCWLQDETSERFLPQMLGLDSIGAISFTKGCYPGQEIIARTRYLGKLKRRPVLLEVDGKLAIKPGASCALSSTDDNIEAVVVEAASPDGNTTTLLLVAPLEPTAEVHSMEFEGEIFTARRIERASD